MSVSFSTFEATDPHQIGRMIWERIPLQHRGLLNEREHCSRVHEALDRRRFQSEPETFRSRYYSAYFDSMLASRVVDARAIRTTACASGIDAYFISLMESGSAEVLRAGSSEPIVGNTKTGMVFRGEGSLSFASSDCSDRFTFWVSGRLLRERLAVLLDGREAKSLAFQPTFDRTRGPGATISNMLALFFAESARSDSLLTNDIAVRSFENTLALFLLLGLPHSHTERLRQQRVAAAPGNVRRAEEFMRANVSTAVTIADVAQAAGCSVRALQMAFRRFGDTTPTAALRRMRLEETRARILRANRAESLARIAADYGFNNPGRFAQLFRRTYGAYPSELLRTRGGDIGTQSLKPPRGCYAP